MDYLHNLEGDVIDNSIYEQHMMNIVNEMSRYRVNADVAVIVAKASSEICGHYIEDDVIEKFLTSYDGITDLLVGSFVKMALKGGFANVGRLMTNEWCDKKCGNNDLCYALGKLGGVRVCAINRLQRENTRDDLTDSQESATVEREVAIFTEEE